MNHIMDSLLLAFQLTIELFDGDEEQAAIWFNSPQEFLFNNAPASVCIRGDGDELINWLKVRLGKKDGVAF